jgi:Zn-dependent peptidase ImmA (M78 family)/DNA-binding XRE family transcriptional regulator
MFNAALLRVAREAADLKQSELAAAAGLDQAEISRWERGLRQPGPEKIRILGAALQIDPHLLEQPIPITEPVHRSARIESKRVQRKVNGRLELTRIALSRLLADFDLDSPFQFPTFDDPGPRDPEGTAAAVRRVWRIPDGPLINLSHYLEAAGAVVAEVDFGSDAIIAAFENLPGNSRWFFLNSRSTDNARSRFSLAHELGHAALHWDRFDAPVGTDAEREAHRFAASLLMPARDLRRELAGSRLAISELVEIGERWGVSAQALLMRAEDLGVISRHQKGRHFRRLNAQGILRAGLVNVPPEQPRVIQQALQVQRQVNKYSDGELAGLLGLPLLRLGELVPNYFPIEQVSKVRLKLVPPS